MQLGEFFFFLFRFQSQLLSMKLIKATNGLIFRIKVRIYTIKQLNIIIKYFVKKIIKQNY